MSFVKRQIHYRLQQRIPSPLLILLAALSLLLTGTWLAFKQSPQPAPFASKTLPDRFLYPLESNAFQRLAKISIDVQSVFSLPDSQLVWAVGDAGLIIHSSDGGITWKQQHYPVDQQQQRIDQTDHAIQQRSLLEFFLADALAADMATAISTEITQSLDYRKSPDLNKIPVKRTKLPPALNVGAKVNVRTKANLNGTDEKQVPGTIEQEQLQDQPVKKPDLNAVFFIDAKRGSAVGDDGVILHTADGGVSWLLQGSGTGEWLKSVTFTDALHGWVVGYGGVILHTKDGGINWQRQGGGTKADFNSVTFSDALHGWLVGTGGDILYTADGGVSWLKQSSGTDEVLTSIMFADAQHGWAVGNGGIILHTPDGGISWQRQSSGTDAWLTSVMFTDTRRGWAVGDKGVILHTADGGVSWEKQNNGTAVWLASVTFADARHGWAMGKYGIFLHTADGGISWQRQSSGPDGRFTSVMFTDTKRGWAVGLKGIILHTADGGDIWQSQGSGTDKWLTSVTFSDARHGWVVGDGGIILHTTDGGINWQRQSSGIEKWLGSVTFTDAKRGWAVGDKGLILHTTDSGGSWQRQSGGTSFVLRSVTFSDSRHGWAVGDGGIILYTADGGLRWQRQSSGTDAGLRSVTFSDSRHAWAVGNGGIILYTADGGVNWQQQSSATDAGLRSVTFSDARHGWVVGDDGVILYTADGGGSWKRQNGATIAGLRSVAVTDTRHVWAVGSLQTILYTTDAGKNWITPLYKRYPAGWYYLLCLVLLGLTGLALTARQKQEDREETIADLLASDRPLQTGDPDPLGFTEIARGLSRFVRNPRTEPPLTIAVTGEWGTGKSSLMNLLYEDLRDKGFSTVWFNAWHHQKSEQLLAILFANMRRQAIPGWLCFSGFRPVGLLFRLRLLLHRSRRHWLLFLLMVFLFSAALAYILEESGHFSQLLNWLDSNLTELSRQVKIVFALGATSATLLPLFVFFRSLRGFALNPLKLMTIQSAEGQKAGSIDPGARYQFAREFRDVTSSLDLGRMIIFIDDLDRCAKENVLEVLEAINFLVTSGNCYIILGMARDWVQICVGLGFKELATESFSNNRGDAKLDPVEFRRKFAMQYLEKMINIEVPVPLLDESKALLLTLPKSRQHDMSASGRVHSIIDRYLNHWPVLVFLMVIGLGVYIGLEQELPELKVPAMKKSQPEIISVWPAEDLEIMTEQGGGVFLRHNKEPVNAAVTSKQTADALQWVLQGDSESLGKGLVIQQFANGKAELLLRRAADRIADQNAESRYAVVDSEFKSAEETSSMSDGEFTPGIGNQALWPRKIPYAVLLVILLTGLILLFRKPERIVEDSKPFREALQIWQEWLILRKQTPRTIKRFLNHLRYMAMRYRDDEEPRSLWQRWRYRQRQQEARAVFSEPSLVALSVLHYIEPTWVSSSEKFRQINRQKFDQLLDEIEIDQDFQTVARERIREQFVKTVAAHKKIFQVDVLATDEQRNYFCMPSAMP